MYLKILLYVCIFSLVACKKHTKQVNNPELAQNICLTENKSDFVAHYSDSILIECIESSNFLKVSYFKNWVPSSDMIKYCLQVQEIPFSLNNKLGFQRKLINKRNYYLLNIEDLGSIMSGVVMTPTHNILIEQDSIHIQVGLETFSDTSSIFQLLRSYNSYFDISRIGDSVNFQNIEPLRIYFSERKNNSIFHFSLEYNSYKKTSIEDKIFGVIQSIVKNQYSKNAGTTIENSNILTFSQAELHFTRNTCKRNLDGIRILSPTKLEVDNEFIECTKLAYLQLYNVDSTVFNSLLMNIVTIRSLSILNSTISPSQIKFNNLSSLWQLRICSSNFDSLPINTDKLNNLVFLDLSKNNFTTFPIGLTALKSLRYLDISGNDLTGIPFEFVQLTNLKQLVINTKFEENPILKKMIESQNLEIIYADYLK